MPNFSLSKSGGGDVDAADDDDVDENNNSLRNLYTHYMRECVWILCKTLNVIHSSCLGYIRAWMAVTATIATAKITKKMSKRINSHEDQDTHIQSIESMKLRLWYLRANGDAGKLTATNTYTLYTAYSNTRFSTKTFSNFFTAAATAPCYQ